MQIIPFSLLSSSDLIIDAVCEGGSQGNAADDPISKILEGVGNQGGFRAAGRGTDAIGRYLLGLSDDPVYAEFSLEAKCYQPGIDETSPNTVGVREASRLISRIRHRQFGVLVTTSMIARQAYEEVREDRHPIIFLSGRDITNILVNNAFNTPELVTSLLHLILR